MIDGKDSSVSYIAGKLQFRNSEWIPLVTGPDVKGNIFAKLDREKSVAYITGMVSLVPTQGGNYQILAYPTDEFSFAVDSSLVLQPYSPTTDYAWFIGSDSGNLTSTTNLSGMILTQITLVFCESASFTSKGDIESGSSISLNNTAPIEVPIKIS